METNHVVSGLQTKGNNKSVFTLLAGVVSCKSENPKKCVLLIKDLHGKEFAVGSSTNLQYSLKRLIRGLGSTKPTPQTACFAALTAVLKFEDVGVTEVLAAIQSELETNISHGEEGPLNTGIVLACGAIINSGMYFKTSGEQQQLILQKLTVAGHSKSYLSFPTVNFVINIIHNVDKSNFKTSVWSFIKKEITNSNTNRVPIQIDYLYLLLVAQEKHPNLVAKFIQKEFHSVEDFNKILVDNLALKTLKIEHPIFNLACQNFVKSQDSLLELWSNQVVLHKDNAQKHHFLICLLSCILKHLPDTETNIIPNLLTPGIVDVLIRVLSLKKRQTADVNSCYTVGNELLLMIVNALTKEGVEDAIRMKTLKKLLFYPGNIQFEMKTKTKCVQLIVSKLGLKAIMKLSKMYQKIIMNELKKVINEEKDEEDWNSMEQQYVLHHVVKLIHHPVVRENPKWKLTQLTFLFDLAFIKNEEVSSVVRECAKECFYKAVEFQSSKLKDIFLLLSDCMNYIDGRLDSHAVELTPTAMASWLSVREVVNKFLKKVGDKSLLAIHVLLVHMALHLFKNPELAGPSISDLLTCYKHLKKGGKEGAEELHWTEVTVDLILSTLSRENKLWRHVISCVFPHIVPHMTSNALHLIIQALDPNSEKSMLEHDDSESESGSESEGGEEGSVDKEEEDEEEEEEEEDDSEEDDDVEDKVSDKLRMAVRDALGYSAALTDEESVDMDDMDEEEGHRLNESLSKAFKLLTSQRQSRNKKQSKEEEAVTHFRNRVLDLIHIYLSTEPPLSGCLDLILPLFVLLETAIKDRHQRPLQNRLESTLDLLGKVKKMKDCEGVTNDVLVDLLKAVVNREGISGLMYVEMSPRIASCCAFLARSSQALCPEGHPAFVEEFNSLLSSYFTTKDSKLPISMFHSVLRMYWTGNWKSVETLYSFLLVDNLRVFKKMKVVEMLEMFYKNDRLHSTALDESVAGLRKVEARFTEKFVSTLDKYHEMGSSIAKLVVPYLTKLLTVIRLAESRARKRGAGGAALWTTILEELAKIRALVGNPIGKAQLFNIAREFGVTLPALNIEKTKAEEEGEDSEELSEEETTTNGDSKKGKAKKRKMKPDNRKLKKMSRELREQASSQGLQGIQFHNVNLDDIQQSSEGSEDEEVEVQKRKKHRQNGDVPKRKRKV